MLSRLETSSAAATLLRRVRQRQSEISRWGKRMRIPPLPLRAVEPVATRLPYADGVVVVLENGPQAIGAVRPIPRLLEEIAQKRVGIDAILNAPVHSVDVRELGAHLLPLLVVLRILHCVGALIAFSDLLRELKLQSNEVHSPRSQ